MLQDDDLQSTPAGHVKPRIEAIERRMQLRTPDAKGGGHPTMQTPAPSSSDANVAAQQSAIVLRSPALAAITNSNIKQFESDVLKRQAEYTERITDLEGRLALFHTRLATECAERGRAHALTMEEYVDGPLEEAVRRSLQMIETEFVRPIMDPKRAVAATSAGANANGQSDDDEAKQSSSVDDCEERQNDAAATANRPLPNLVQLERRTNLLEAQMNHHQHVTLFHSRRQNYDAIDQTCRTSLQPALALEMTKADKREGHMARRFESSSGEYTRLVSELTSSRVSSLGYIEKEIDGWDVSDMKKAERYLEEIQKLKQRVMEEREERIRQDEVVVERIVEKRKMLEQDIFMAC